MLEFKDMLQEEFYVTVSVSKKSSSIIDELGEINRTSTVSNVDVALFFLGSDDISVAEGGFEIGDIEFFIGKDDTTPLIKTGDDITYLGKVYKIDTVESHVIHTDAIHYIARR
jgi:hypothetical protein